MFIKILSLRAKLLLLVMPIILAGLILITAGAYWFLKSVIEEELTSSMMASVSKSAESINRWISTLMLEPETIASTPAAKKINKNFAILDYQNLQRHKALHKKFPDIFKDIYAANSEGEYHTVVPKKNGYGIFKGNIFNRNYFQSIMNGGPTQITPPLISRTTGVPTMFIVSPIHDENGNPQGLIGAGISLEYIQKITKELQAGKTGYGFIIASDGTYIYHPDSSLVMKSKITEAEDQQIKTLGIRMISGTPGTYTYNEKGRNLVVLYSPIPIAGWSVATVLPEVEMLAPAIRMVKFLLAITVFFSILVGLAIMVAMGRLTRPLNKLSQHAQEISAGNLELAALKVQSRDEIGQLSQAFNSMTASLKTSISELAASENNYKSIFRNSLLGIVQVSMEGKILNANPAFIQMLGYDSLENLIENTEDVKTDIYADPEDRLRIIQQLFEKDKLQGIEVELKNRRGKTFWVSIDIRLIRDSEGTPLRIESLVSDINHRIESEQERTRLQNQLVQAQKLEAVGKLAGGVAHDFNNILSVIIGKSEIALLKMAPSDPFYDFFVDIKKAAGHSANLTRQLLAFARKQAIAPQVVDINMTLEETLSMLRRIISEGIELTQIPKPDLWKVKIDPDQLVQILTNLCVNARDAIDGIGKIIIRTDNCTLDEAYYTNMTDYLPGDYVCLSVSDDGCGMDKETQQQIFEPFFTTKARHKGTGLGLATVYGIVKQNNGFINIYSEVNQGATFKIYLPRYQGNDAHSPVSETNPHILHGTESILLVEDEPELLKVSKQMLKELGYTVFPANSPEEAIEYVRQYGDTIDLVITDVIMPKMNGRDLAQHIFELHPQIGCLFMSGYTADIIAHQGILNEGLHFLQKPFSLKALADAVRKSLEPDHNRKTML